MTRTVLASVFALLAGVVAALVGGVSHRAAPWWGLVGCIALVAVGGVFMRAWRAWLALGVFAGGWAVVTVILSLEGPGGSVLIMDDALGRAWLIGGTLAVMGVALVPRRWLGQDDVAF